MFSTELNNPAKAAFSDYTNGVSVSLPLQSSGERWEVPDDGYLVVTLHGSFINDYSILVNDAVVLYAGDDMNNNTKWTSGIIPLKKGSQVCCKPGSYNFEIINTTFYAV